MAESTTGTLPLATAQVLAKKIRTRRARVGVVGLGYVGLPLAVEFAAAGFTVIGIDISEEKVRRVNAGDSYVGDIPSSTLAPLVEAGRLRATTDFSAVRSAPGWPTPLYQPVPILREPQSKIRGRLHKNQTLNTV